MIYIIIVIINMWRKVTTEHKKHGSDHPQCQHKKATLLSVLSSFVTPMKRQEDYVSH